MDRTTIAPQSVLRRGLTLRRRLLLMALSLIAPAVVFMALLVAAAYRDSTARFDQQLLATTRALSLASDRQLAQGDASLRGLAVSPELERGELDLFEEQARKSVAGQNAWILLSDPNGQLINTRLPVGQKPTGGRLQPETWAALMRGETKVSNLVTGPVIKRPIISIDKPVLSGGRLLALSYVQDPDALRSIFTGQKIPPTWTASILDRNGVLVARSRDHEELLGRAVAGAMLAAMQTKNEGLVMNRTLDGTPSLSSFSRSPTYGWSFVVSVPRHELSRATLGSVTLLGLATGLLLLMAASLATLVARSISRETRSLMDDAHALVGGGPIPTRPRDLWETAQVRRALQNASRELQARQEANDTASARQELMIHELNHRVKNTLSTVQSLAHQSLGSPDGDPRVKSFVERLLALAKAHDLLTERVWEGADLRDVVERILKPYGARASVEGPPVALSPNTTVSLSMVFHELATNAAKYGALANDEGRIAVTWTIDAAARQLKLVWRETGGPPVVPPERTGFGARLIRASITGELGGRPSLDYRPEGLVCSLFLPLSDAIRAVGESPRP